MLHGSCNYKNKNIKTVKFFEMIGSEIGLLFQIADDLIDYKGDSKKLEKKLKKIKNKEKLIL